MSQAKRWLVMVAVLGLVAGLGRADEEKVPLSKLPKKVVDAVKAKYPDAKLVKAEKEKEDNETVYEVAIENDGQKLEVHVKPDGTITEVERVIAIKDLPAKVAKAIEKKYPKASLKLAEEVTKGTKVYYEVVLETADNKKFEIVLSPSGKIEKTESKDKKKEKKEEK
jgi:uncharacterized membrane protein YkoI